MKTSGASLLEVLIALSIFAITLLGTARFCFYNLHLARETLDHSFTLIKEEHSRNNS